MPRIDPYAHAPKLPDGDEVDVRVLAKGTTFELEIGPGRGGFVTERLAVDPSIAFLGFEVRRKWATIVDDRLKKSGLGARARVFAEDAKLALPRLRPNGIFQRAFLHFPDPWWKKRHEKRLVMGDVFLEEVARLLCSGGELLVQTDVEDRANQYRAQIDSSPLYEPFGDAAGSPWLADNPYFARSPREHRAIRDGLPVFRLRYRTR